MLWEPRLCPAFGADTCAYACLIHNRVPNSFLGGDRTPEGILTGHRVRWDKFRVFGCDVYEVIPNNKLAKVPGLPRGRKCIFVGFDVDRAGFKLFDPTTRTYHSAGDVYFYEDFSERIDALRHHDQRRAIMRRGEEQPIVMNDFDDETAGAVRSLYLDPDAAAPDESDGRRDLSSLDLSGEAAAALDASGGALVPSDAQLGGALVPSDASLRGAASRSDLERATDDSFPVNPSGPPPRRSAAAERARLAAQQHFMLRPLRLLVVGKEAPYTVEDQAFLHFVKTNNVPLVYRKSNPKRVGTESFDDISSTVRGEVLDA